MRYSLAYVDGNAYAIMGYVTRALKNEGMRHLVESYRGKAMSSNYDNLVAVSQEVIDLCNQEAANREDTDEDE